MNMCSVQYLWVILSVESEKARALQSLLVFIHGGWFCFLVWIIYS